MEGLARAKGALSHHAAFKVDLPLLSEKVAVGHLVIGTKDSLL